MIFEDTSFKIKFKKMEALLDILKKNQLSVTDGRKKILELFLHSDGALAHADIEKNTGENFDRVTVYRTLQTFVDKGIIHVIPTTDNSILYALCKDNCEITPYGHHIDLISILKVVAKPKVQKVLLEEMDERELSSFVDLLEKLISFLKFQFCVELLRMGLRTSHVIIKNSNGKCASFCWMC